MNSNVKNAISSRYIAFACCVLFYGYQYILRVFPSVVIDDVMNIFDMSASSFGQFAGLYYMGYIAAHIPLGIMLDRFNTKIVIICSIFLVIVGTLPIVCSSSKYVLVIGRVVLGIGSSCAVLSVFKIISALFPRDKFASMLGIMGMFGFLCAMYGGKPMSYLLNAYGLSNIVYGLLFIGILLAILIVFCVPNVAAMNRSENSKDVISDIKEILSSKIFIYIGLTAGCFVTPTEGFADAWGAKFFEIIHELSYEDAILANSLIFFGMAIGCLFVGRIVSEDKYNIAILWQGVVMCACFVYMIIVIPCEFYVISTLCAVVGLASSYQVLTCAKIVNHFPEKSGVASSCINMVTMGFGYLSHSTIGATVDAFVISGEYTRNSYAYGTASVVVVFLMIGIAFMLLHTMREMHN